MRETPVAAIVLTASLVFATSFASLSLADEISQVRAAISAKQARWQAGETSVTRLSPEQRQARLGLIKPTGLTGLFSPPMADVIAADEGLRSVARSVLEPIAAASETLLGAGREPAGLLGWLGAAVILLRRWRQGSRRDKRSTE